MLNVPNVYALADWGLFAFTDLLSLEIYAFRIHVQLLVLKTENQAFREDGRCAIGKTKGKGDAVEWTTDCSFSARVK